MVVVGPAHPYRGGVVAHTATLTHRILERDGVEAKLVSWSRLYPELIYPGDRAKNDEVPDVPLFPDTTYPLRWYDPAGYGRVGRLLGRSGVEDLVLVLVVPFHAPSLLAVAAAARAAARRRGTRPPRVVVVAHNVLPHEPHVGARQLVSRLLLRADRVVVHTAAQAELALALHAREVVVAGMPPFVPAGLPRDPVVRPLPGSGPARLLFFGLVRRYKGVDVLLDAMREVDGARLTIAGDLWGGDADAIRAAVLEPGLADRVTLREGYVPAGEVPELMRSHDAVVLPYREGTASQHVLMAHAYGMPVVASMVGSFPAQIRHEVDGLLVPPNDAPALAAALRRLVRPEVLEKLRVGVPVIEEDAAWHSYVSAVLDD